ncbi:uncharacterized protein [Rutidosis leptorrhynchoides]|uniref:uncharacterized protein isoform X2 n=1 Tax=Rutidosis leptorrhynchoides TaxID=125765 RepID=UPI003A997F34
MQLTAPNMVSLMSFRRRVDGYYLSSGCHYTMLSFTQRRTKTSINVSCIILLAIQPAPPFHYLSAMLMRRSLSRHSSMITGNSFLKSYLYPLLNALLTDHHEISDHFLLA